MLRTLNSPELVASFQRACGIRVIPQVNNNKNQTVNGNSNHAKTTTHQEANGHSQYSNGHTTANGHVTDKHDDHPDEHDERTNKSYWKSVAMETYTIENNFLYYLFQFGSSLGDEVFYIIFYPFFMWNCDYYLGRLCIYFWAIYMYVGQATKDIVRWPRPAAPPVVRLEHLYGLEHGMPSTHAMVGFGIPFTLWYFSLDRYADILVGLVYVGVLSALCWPWLPALDHVILTQPWVPLVTVTLTSALCLLYPSQGTWNTARGDTTLILAVAAGIVSSAWMLAQYGSAPAAVTSPPYALTPPSLVTLRNCLLRLLVGSLILVPVRFLLKFTSSRVVCAVCRVSPSDQIARRRLAVEFPIKYFTYSVLAVVATILAPMVFQYVGIENEFSVYGTERLKV